MYLFEHPKEKKLLKKYHQAVTHIVFQSAEKKQIREKIIEEMKSIEAIDVYKKEKSAPTSPANFFNRFYAIIRYFIPNS